MRIIRQWGEGYDVDADCSCINCCLVLEMGGSTELKVGPRSRRWISRTGEDKVLTFGCGCQVRS